jgi:hypothetical protein
MMLGAPLSFVSRLTLPAIDQSATAKLEMPSASSKPINPELR